MRATRGPYRLPFRDHARDRRELTRLRIVALACEVAVLTALMDEDLTPISRHPDAQDLKYSCWEHRRMALELLFWPETRLDQLSDESLLQAVDSFQARLKDVLGLRMQTDRLRSAGAREQVPISAIHPRSNAPYHPNG